MRKNRIAMKLLTAVLSCSLLMSSPLSCLAEEAADEALEQSLMIEETDDGTAEEFEAAGEDAPEEMEISEYDEENGDEPEEEKKESKEEKKELTEEDIQKVKQLEEDLGLQELIIPDPIDPVKIDGVSYYNLFEKNSQKAMKDIDSKELFTKVLESKRLTGKSVVSEVWIRTAKAALLSGGYNKYYYVDPYWTPDTFDRAFVKWKSTWCRGYGDDYLEDMGQKDPQYAKTFKQVGENMLESIKNDSVYIKKALKDGLKAYDGVLDQWKVPEYETKYQGDILFYPFTKVIYRKGGTKGDCIGYAYDSFALCFYDFQVVPLTDNMTVGSEADQTICYEELSKDPVANALEKNDTAGDFSFSVQRSDSKSMTTSNTVSTSSSLSFTEGAKIAFEKEFKSEAVNTKIGFEVNFSSTQSSTQSKSTTTGESLSQTNTYTVSGTLKPDTQVTVNESNVTKQGVISYSCPVSFKYKVAVLSLCGSYSGSMPNRQVKVNYAGAARIFDQEGDALADVHDRYTRPQYDDYHLVWDENEKMFETLLHEAQLYSNIGGTMSFIIEENNSTASKYCPLYPLKKTVVDPQKTSYEITLSNNPDQNRLNLGTVDVEGLDKNEITYFRFLRSKGSWKICDSNENVIETSEYAKIEKTPTGTWLVAEKPGKVYLKYFIDEDWYPAKPGSTEKTTLKNADLEKSAVIEVNIHAEKVSPAAVQLTDESESGTVVRIDPESGRAVLDLNADTELEYAALDEDGVPSDDLPAVTWKAAREYETCEVTEEGMFTATAEGDYEVLVTCLDTVSNAVTIHVEAQPEPEPESEPESEPEPIPEPESEPEPVPEPEPEPAPEPEPEEKALPLGFISVPEGKEAYSIHLCGEHPEENSLYLGSIDIEGYSYDQDGNAVPYAFFNRLLGRWEFCDEEGNITGESDLASIENDYLTAESGGTVYLTYIINEDTYPVDPEDPEKGYLTSGDLEGNVIVEITIYDDEQFEGSLVLVDGNPVILELDPELEYVQEDLCAYENLEYAVVDEEGNWLEEKPAVIWETDEDYEGCMVTEDGILMATQPGEYNIHVTYHGAISNSVTVYVNEMEISGIELMDLYGEDSPLRNIVLDYDVESDLDLLGDDSGVQLTAVMPDGGRREFTDEELSELFWDYDGPVGGIYIDNGNVSVYEEGSYQIYVSYNGIRSNPLELTVTAPEENWEEDPEEEFFAEEDIFTEAEEEGFAEAEESFFIEEEPDEEIG